eukprot:m.59761 g.59761  ORF g.59761 m.59761 type:complete len:263 (+) comp11271_c0_seq1:255-1043(+)
MKGSWFETGVVGTQYHQAFDFLVSPYAFGLGSVFYLAFVALLKMSMSKKEAFTCVLAMRVYNVIQIVLCGYMTVGLIQDIRLAEPFEISGFQVPNIMALNHKVTKNGEYFMLIHYFSKFLDFFDTIFIVLKKKDRQLSFLHVYHHATIGPIWGFLLFLGCGGGSCLFGACLNSFVHVLMYSHYLMTSFKINNPFKKQLTQVQITQFYFCILHAFLATFFDTEVPQELAYLQLCYHISMIVLFTRFLMQSHPKKPTAETKKTS